MATKTEELFSMVESLPVDIKTQLVEKILIRRDYDCGGEGASCKITNGGK